MKYVGQTRRTFIARFKEHIQEISNNRHRSKFVRYVLDAGHAYNTINQTMDVLHIESKGKKLNTLERFEIYKLTKNALQLNDTHTVTHNPIFDVIRKRSPPTQTTTSPLIHIT
jgi:hypothetical protein